jgi:hypothetical protein
MNLGARPLARCGLESDAASKMVAWSVPWSNLISAMAVGLLPLLLSSSSIDAVSA